MLCQVCLEDAELKDCEEEDVAAAVEAGELKPDDDAAPALELDDFEDDDAAVVETDELEPDDDAAPALELDGFDDDGTVAGADELEPNDDAAPALELDGFDDDAAPELELDDDSATFPLETGLRAGGTEAGKGMLCAEGAAGCGTGLKGADSISEGLFAKKRAWQQLAKEIRAAEEII